LLLRVLYVSHDGHLWPREATDLVLD